MKKSSIFLIVLGLCALYSVSKYNSLQGLDESTTSTWSEVLNQFQRRADLVPNLVNTVKGYASHEADVFTKVTEARAQVGSLKITPELVKDEAAMAQFQSAQQNLGSALSKLIAVSENYPALKADANFRDLQAQLEGTENRIAVARNRYIETIKTYNTAIRSFPGNFIAGFAGLSTKQNFKVENEAAVSKPPVVEFGK